jgi:hypothetical protein
MSSYSRCQYVQAKLLLRNLLEQAGSNKIGIRTDLVTALNKYLNILGQRVGNRDELALYYKTIE